jgi:phenylalanine-4-hydroxylase
MSFQSFDSITSVFLAKTQFTVLIVVAMVAKDQDLECI